MDMGRFLPDIHYIRYGCLHLKGQFILSDSRKYFRIAHVLVFQLVDFIDDINGTFSQVVVNFIGIGEKKNRLSLRATLDTLMYRRQKPASPCAFSSTDSPAPRSQYHESRKIIVF